MSSMTLVIRNLPRKLNLNKINIIVRGDVE